MLEYLSELHVDLDVLLKLAVALHTVLYLGNVVVIRSQQPCKELAYSVPLCLGEYVGSHIPSIFPIVGKGLNLFASCSWKCRVCASEGEAKNSTIVKGKTDANH